MEGLGFLYNDIEGSLHLPRALLAAASDAEYEAAVAGVAALNRSRRAVRRDALLPEQESWAAEVCSEWNSDHYAVKMLLWQTIERPEHLAAAGLQKLDGWQISSGMVSAIIDNLGAASLPILTATLRQHLGVDHREPVLDAIALLPSEEAMSYLLDHLAAPFVFAATRKAVARYPRRALSRLAAAGRSGDHELRPRLAALAAAVPTDCHSGLPSGDLVAIEELLAPSPVPDAAPETLPPLLTAPPWTVKRPKEPSRWSSISKPRPKPGSSGPKANRSDGPIRGTATSSGWTMKDGGSTSPGTTSALRATSTPCCSPTRRWRSLKSPREMGRQRSAIR